MESCIYDDDCKDLNFCTLYNFCQHYPFYPPEPIEIIGSILIGLFVGIENIGGTGPGLAKSLCFMIIMNYSNKESTYLTYPVNMGMKIGYFLLLFWNKHPIIKDRPLIDYQAVLIIIPASIMGSIIGVIFNNILPNQAIIFFFTMFIAYEFSKTIKLAMKNNNQKFRHQKELNQLSEVTLNKPDGNKDEDLTLLILKDVKQNNNFLPQSADQIGFQQQIIDQSSSQGPDQSNVSYEKVEKGDIKLEQIQINESEITEEQRKSKQQYEQILQSRSAQYPWKRIIQIIGVFLLFQLILVIMGSNSFESFARFEMLCGPCWVFLGLLFVLISVVLYLVRRQLVYEEKIMIENNHQFHSSDIKYIEGFKNFCLNGFLGGLIIGTFGMGGELILAQTLLSLGAHPSVSRGTIALLIIFISATACEFSLIVGIITENDFPFISILTIIAGSGGLFVTYSLSKLIEYLKLTSSIVFLTAFLQISIFIVYMFYFFFFLNTSPQQFDIQPSSSNYC